MKINSTAFRLATLQNACGFTGSFFLPIAEIKGKLHALIEVKTSATCPTYHLIGGKPEAGECNFKTLAREMDEEIGLIASEALLEQDHMQFVESERVHEGILITEYFTFVEIAHCNDAINIYIDVTEHNTNKALTHAYIPVDVLLRAHKTGALSCALEILEEICAGRTSSEVQLH